MIGNSARKDSPLANPVNDATDMAQALQEAGFHAVPSIAEHTWEMLIACIKLLPIFNITSKTLDSDVLLLSVMLHDAFKYGVDNPLNRQYTDNQHDRLAANMIEKNKSIFLRVFSEDQFYLLEECIRHHPGRWSSDITNIKDLHHEVFFIHLLDMLSTNDLLSIGEEINASKQ